MIERTSSRVSSCSTENEYLFKISKPTWEDADRLDETFGASLLKLSSQALMNDHSMISIDPAQYEYLVDFCDRVMVCSVDNTVRLI